MPTGATTRVTRSSVRQIENEVAMPIGKAGARVTRGSKGKTGGLKEHGALRPRSVLGEINNRGNVVRHPVKKAGKTEGNLQQKRKEQDNRAKRAAKEKAVARSRFGLEQEEGNDQENADVAAAEKTTQAAAKHEVFAPVQALKERSKKEDDVVHEESVPETKAEAPAIKGVKAEETVVVPSGPPQDSVSQPEPAAHSVHQNTDLTAEIEELVLVSADKTAPAEAQPTVTADSEGAATKTEVIDIDHEDIGYPEFVADYVKDIYSYLRTVEAQEAHRVQPDFMKIQTEITHKMRSILINWLVDVHLKFSLLQESLYLCVSLLDRYLSVTVVRRDKLQLVGVCCMLIASKFEEIYAPEVRDFVYICEEAYSRDQVLDMECHILNTLKFCIGTAYALHFLRRASKAADASPECHTMGKYLVELTITNPAMIKYLPSEIAAGCLMLSLKMLNQSNGAPCWDEVIEHYSGYTKEHITGVAKEMAAFIEALPQYPHQSTRKKYQSSKFYRIAYIVDTRIKDVTFD